MPFSYQVKYQVTEVENVFTVQIFVSGGRKLNKTENEREKK